MTTIYRIENVGTLNINGQADLRSTVPFNMVPHPHHFYQPFNPYSPQSYHHLGITPPRTPQLNDWPRYGSPGNSLVNEQAAAINPQPTATRTPSITESSDIMQDEGERSVSSGQASTAKVNAGSNNTADSNTIIGAPPNQNTLFGSREDWPQLSGWEDEL